MVGPIRPIGLAALIAICGASRASSQPAMTLSVDASQARLKILHASLSMSARSGPLTLVYPKWIPGEHMPSGPISNLAGLDIFTDGAELMWRRDLVNMNAFHVTVPAGARTMTASYDYVVPTGGGAFGATASANAKCAVINWNTVVLSPEGENSDAIRVMAALRLPAGWKEAGALDVALAIRKLTGGRKSLDDFCALFHGENDNGRIYVKPYEASDVYAALERVASFTWKEFFEKRLTSKSAELPLGGAANGGYRLVHTDAPNLFVEPPASGNLNAIGSLGIHVTADGTVDDTAPGAPAYRAGISNGMKIVAVNSRRFSVELLSRAIADSKNTRTPMEFIVDNGGYFSVTKVDYHGGLQYPHFERIGGTDDLLTPIAQPRIK